MKLRNLIFALFLAIGAIGFTACTGDDGAQGPQGDQGEQGEKGDPGESGDASGTYAFLKSWGSADGTVTCSDDILQPGGPLPGGPDILGSLANAAQVVTGTPNPDGAITAACGTAGIFSDIDDEAIEGLDDTLGDVNDDLAVTRGLAFIKTGRGNADPEVMRVPSTEFNRAAQVVTNKVFVGGKVFADLDFAADSPQPVERLNLYNQCSVGTSPSAVIGQWQAVRITAQATLFADGAQLDTNNDGTPDALPAPTVTTKVCVVLDAHPGVTKCFVNVTGDVVNPANNGPRIALYDGTSLTTVVKAADLSAVDATGDLFVSGDTAAGVAAVRLCDLFK